MPHMGDHKDRGVQGPGFLQLLLKLVKFFLIDFKRGNQRKINDVRSACKNPAIFLNKNKRKLVSTIEKRNEHPAQKLKYPRAQVGELLK